MESSRQELRWVLRAQAGDREAFDSLLETLQAPLYRYITSLIGARPLAEDVLQEVFLIIYRKIGWLREPELFRPWVYRIATREAFRMLRRERKLSERVEDEAILDEVPAPEGDLSSDEDRELIARLPGLLATLSPGSRAVLALHYLQELTLAQVAEILGLSIGTVKSRLAYGLSALRKQLELDS